MKLSVATNFDNRLIYEIKRYPVYELFGKLPSDFIGGGRASYMLSPLKKKEFEHHLREAHKNGLRFNYLLNTACMDNMEFTRKGQKEIDRILHWLSDIGVDTITVAIPFLLSIIKKRYPHFKARVGVFAMVDTVSKAKFWEELGADCITLEAVTVNREVSLLKKIRRSVKCDLQLIVNFNCLLHCPIFQYHMVNLSHGSQSHHPSGGFLLDYCILLCTYLKLSEPINYIKSQWIRPEDIRYYKEIGYDNFKLLERNAPTDVMVKRVRAYSEERYDGNLLDLIEYFGYDGEDNRRRFYYKGIFWNIKNFLNPLKVNPVKLLKIKRLAELRGALSPLKGKEPVYIDNRKLDGFLGHFFDSGCLEKDCDECHHCHNVASDAIRINEEARSRCLDLYRDIFHDLLSGDMWKLLPRRNG